MHTCSIAAILTSRKLYKPSLGLLACWLLDPSNAAAKIIQAGIQGKCRMERRSPKGLHHCSTLQGPRAALIGHISMAWPLARHTIICYPAVVPFAALSKLLRPCLHGWNTYSTIDLPV